MSSTVDITCLKGCIEEGFSPCNFEVGHEVIVDFDCNSLFSDFSE
jgi:hypothetical protein